MVAWDAYRYSLRTPMTTAINPALTDAGLAAAVAANGAGLQLGITHVAIGTGQYVPTGGQTLLVNRKEKAVVSSGVSLPGGFELTVNFPSWAGTPNPYNATEIGFYAGDPDAGGVLFAVHSHPSDVIVQRNAANYTATFGLLLSRVPLDSVTVTATALVAINAAVADVDAARTSALSKLSAYGYLPPVAYAAGLIMTLSTQTVSFSGLAYAPILSTLPFTTSGTFEAGKFRLIQGVIAADLAAPGGAVMVHGIASGTGAIDRPLQDKLRERVSVNDYWIGATDATVATQNAVNTSREVRFVAGFTYNLSSGASLDINIPANTKIIIEKGAVVNCTNIRFNAYNVNDVEWLIDGKLNLLAMAAAPAKTGWPNTAAGTQNGDERGFLEFGGSDVNSASVSGFTVHGTGKITGPWTGTPNFSDSVFQVNRKGIAGWNCKNMLVEGVEILGFDGEQVYAYINTPDCTNIIFNLVNSHHCRFNALNFNVQNITQLGAYRGLKITDCVSDTCYANIEASAGVITGNYGRAATNYGIWFGIGSGRGPMDVSSNTIEDCAGESYVLSFSSSLVTPVRDVNITNNKAINSGTNAYAFNKLQGFTVTGNTSRGHASTGAGKSFAFTNCTQGWVDGNITFSPGAFSTGNLTTVTSIVNQGSNPVIDSAGTAVTANGTHYGFGGKYAAVTTYGNRENQWAAWSSDFASVGQGAEYVFKNGSGGNSIYAAISGKGGAYDAAGSIGGVVIATKKASTSQVLPTATIEFNDAGNTVIVGALIVSDPAVLHATAALPLTLGAGAGTVTNAPRAGNPTKWVAIKDAGVFRYFPTWEF
jgi:hypothetical protein